MRVLRRARRDRDWPNLVFEEHAAMRGATTRMRWERGPSEHPDVRYWHALPRRSTGIGWR